MVCEINTNHTINVPDLISYLRASALPTLLHRQADESWFGQREGWRVEGLRAKVYGLKLLRYCFNYQPRNSHKS